MIPGVNELAGHGAMGVPPLAKAADVAKPRARVLTNKIFFCIII
jgi:hypothetical protein